MRDEQIKSLRAQAESAEADMEKAREANRDLGTIMERRKESKCDKDLSSSSDDETNANSQGGGRNCSKKLKKMQKRHDKDIKQL